MGRSKKNKHASKFILCIDLEGKYELLLDLKVKSKISKEQKSTMEKELSDIIARKKMTAQIISKMQMNQKIIVDQIYEESLKATLEKYEVDVVDYFANLRSIDFKQSKGRIAVDARSKFELGEDAEVIMATSDSKKFLGEPNVGIINMESDEFSMDTKSMVTEGKIHRLGSISQGVNTPALAQDAVEVEMFQVISDELMPEEIKKLLDKPNKTPEDYDRITKYFEKKLKKEIEELNRARHSNIQRQDELKRIMISRDPQGRRIINIGEADSTKMEQQKSDGTLPIIRTGKEGEKHIDLVRIKNGQMQSVTFNDQMEQHPTNLRQQNQKNLPMQYSIPQDAKFSHAMAERLLELQKLQKPASETLSISTQDLYRVAYQTKQKIEARDGLDLSQVQKTGISQAVVAPEASIDLSTNEAPKNMESGLHQNIPEIEQSRQDSVITTERAEVQSEKQSKEEHKLEAGSKGKEHSVDRDDAEKRTIEERQEEERKREEQRRRDNDNLRRMANEGMEMNAGYASVVTFTDAQDAEVSRKIAAQENDVNPISTTPERHVSSSKAMQSAKDIAGTMISISSNNSRTFKAPSGGENAPNKRQNQRQDRSRN